MPLSQRLTSSGSPGCVRYLARVYLVCEIACWGVCSPTTPHIGCDCSGCTTSFLALGTVQGRAVTSEEIGCVSPQPAAGQAAALATELLEPIAATRGAIQIRHATGLSYASNKTPPCRGRHVVPEVGFEPTKAWLLRPVGVPISIATRAKLMVLKVGLEPTENWHLKPVRLPIAPLEHESISCASRTRSGA